MRHGLFQILFIFLFMLPGLLNGQVHERAETRDQIIPDLTFQTVEEPRELHYTPILLESEEGRQAMELFHQLRDEGMLPLRERLIEDSIGDRRTFKVRNIEESAEGTAVFDDVEFELARMQGDVQIWVEVDELAEERITEDVLDTILNGLVHESPANSVDPGRGVVEITEELFGERPNVNQSGTLKVLISNIQDGWDGEEQHFFTAGFFDPVNLVPREQNENSNFADIININSMPGIYREGTGVVNSRLSTMTHELQHLIHANYGNLVLFQNEGQSELAEILAGFNPRGMSFLDTRTELSGSSGAPQGWVYRFRRTQSNVVLYDYQRAQLLHSYLEERVGPHHSGSVTRSGSAVSNNPDLAYSQPLDAENIDLRDFLTDFYISAYANDEVDGINDFRFSRPQLANIQVSNPGVIHDQLAQSWAANEDVRIYYGGAHYMQWFGVEELTLEIHSSEGISQTILYKMIGDDSFQKMDIGEGTYHMDHDGVYEEIVLLSVNNTPGGNSPSPSDNRTFIYSGDWETTDLVIEPLAYHENPAAFFPLPIDDIYSMALRFSPDFDSNVRNFRIQINNREGAVQGDGELALNLREAEERQGGELYIPGQVLATRSVSAADLSVGSNFIGVNSSEWGVEEGNEYFIELEVVEDFGGLYIELLLDGGVEDNDTNPDYTPVRTVLGVEEDGEPIGWTWFQRRNNWVASVNLIGFKDLGDPEFPEPPVSERFELIKNYPNPFSGSTLIEFNVPERAEIEITVHDALGRKVAELFNGVVDPGLRTLRFNSAGLASGVYVYRMRSPEGTDSKKMTLIN